VTQQAIVGVDVGGTFTDFVFLTAEGEIQVRKRLSTPFDPSRSVLEGLREAREEGLIPPGFALVHGTTVATNALLERRGAATALITTAGFRDMLAIGRQNRETLYSFHPTRTPPLLPRERCFEITERLDWQGNVLRAPERAEIEALLDRLQAEGIESVAVCFLFAYLHPTHERLLGECARARGFRVSLSSEIAPEPREFERASTTVANAFVTPVLARYLGRLESQLQQVEAGTLRIMQSNGGALSADEAAAHAIKTALSGPAGGVVAAAYLGRQAGFSRLLTFDMGGTSTDVALIWEGNCLIASQGELAGLPLRTPMLDIHTVGAGGGSLVWLDAAGSVRVGPQSAGADPGPVAYGKGEELTVTDANVLLGRLPAQVRLAGHLPLHTERVQSHFERLAQRLNLSPQQVALGVVQVVHAAMGRALRHISVERGYDPSDFALLSFGGAGGLHACALADELNMRTVLIPRYPGAFSAFGLALADVQREYVRAFPPLGPLHRLPSEAQQTLSAALAEFQTIAQEELAREGIPVERCDFQPILDLRYRGQSFELRVPFDPAAPLLEAARSFHALHLARYGHADTGQAVEAVATRLLAIGKVARPALRTHPANTPGLPQAQVRIVTQQQAEEAALFARSDLAPGQNIVGPALILQEDATTYLPPGWTAHAEATADILILERDPEET
jgi:N-methylhydantoinase A